MNRRLGTVVGVTLLLAGILLALGVTLSVVFYDAGLLMLLGLLLAGVPMILGAVLLVRLSDRPYPDDLIATNAGFVWVAPVMAAIALFFYHFLLREVDIVVSFLIYEAGIVAVTALLLWRPWYPFSFFLHTLSPNSLSVARLKVLSFLKSHECLRFSLRMTVWMTFGLMTATIVLAFLLSSGYLPSTGRAEFTTPWSFVVGVVMSLVPAVLTAFCIQVGGVLCYILKHWDHVQATYPPFPRAVVPRAFYMGSTKRLMAEPHYPPETAADQHNLLLHPPLIAKLSWRRGVPILCWMIGIPWLYVGVSRLLETLQSPRLFDPHAPTRLVLYMIIPAFLLLLLGRRLWRSR